MTAPLIRTLEQDVPAVATAGNDEDTVLFQAPVTGKVTAVGYVPEAAIAGAATNNRTVSLVNKAQDGTGSTVVASLSFGNGVNADAFDDTAVTLSGTAANLNVTAGDTLVWRSVHVGTGIADPGGLARVTFSRG